MMDKKTKIWILAFAILVFAGLASFLALKSTRQAEKIAVVSLDGAEYARIDLNRVDEAYDIEIDSPYGHNTVHVEPGAISVTEADCPDRICVSMGKLEGGGIPIVCMPHRLVISIEGSGIDG